jgi:uncharacterized membrane protein YhaH (DUF805 family)
MGPEGKTMLPLDAAVISSPDIAVILLYLVLPIFWLVQLVDVLRRRFPDSGTKVAWALAVILLPVIGAVVYAIGGRKMGAIGRPEPLR